jgi:hypothetical protein
MLWNAAAGGGADEQQCALQVLSYALSPTLDASNVTGGAGVILGDNSTKR